MKKSKKTIGELIYGIHPLAEVLKAKRRKVISIYTVRPEPQGWKIIQPLLPKYPIQMQYVDRAILNKMAQTTDHQGVVAWVQSYPVRKKPFDPKKHRFLLMLDGIQDPRNLGALLRSAYCTGVDGIILIKKGGAPLNAVVLKSSAGLAEHIEIYEAPTALAAVQELNKDGYQLYLATFDGNNATQVEYKQPLCLVIGGEGFGISKNILHEGAHVTLPQKDPSISYNASVAGGILLFLIAHELKRM